MWGVAAFFWEWEDVFQWAGRAARGLCDEWGRGWRAGCEWCVRRERRVSDDYVHVCAFVLIEGKREKEIYWVCRIVWEGLRQHNGRRQRRESMHVLHVFMVKKRQERISIT